MNGSEAWKVLADGTESDGIVIAVDFDTTGRPEARFTDLVANLKTDLGVRETIPPERGTEFARTGAGHVDFWASRIEAEQRPVRAVFGYCAGAVFAAPLAERIAERQGGEPLLVLFDPEVSVPQTLLWQFHKVVGLMGSVATAEEIETVREAGARVYEKDPTIGALRDGLIALVREIGEPAFTRAGLGPSRRAELFDAFDSFMGFLAAAAEIDPFARWRSAIAISSASPTSGLNGIRASGVGADRVSVAREIRFDVEHATMLADAEIAAAVTELLRG